MRYIIIVESRPLRMWVPNLNSRRRFCSHWKGSEKLWPIEGIIKVENKGRIVWKHHCRPVPLPLNNGRNSVCKMVPLPLNYGRSSVCKMVPKYRRYNTEFNLCRWIMQIVICFLVYRINAINFSFLSKHYRYFSLICRIDPIVRTD